MYLTAANSPVARPVDARLVTAVLVIFVLVAVPVLNTLVWLLSPEALRTSGLGYVANVLRMNVIDEDSWYCMQQAVDQFFANPDAQNIYQSVFFERWVHFQYPLTSLFPFMGMGWLDQVLGWEYRTRDLVGVASVAIVCASSVLLLEGGLRKVRLERDGAALVALRAVAVIVLTVTFFPLSKAFAIGQAQTWVDALFALSLVAWFFGYNAVAGVLMGLACMVKPQMLVFLPWAVFRREWHFLAGMAAVSALGAIAAIAYFGWQNNISYLSVLSFLSAHGESFMDNHSVNGVVNRLYGVSLPELYDNVHLTPLTGEQSAMRFPPFNVIVYTSSLLTALALLGLAIVHRGGLDRRQRQIDFCLMATASTLGSPIVWSFHYGIFPPIFALILPLLLHRRALLWWSALAFVLMGTYFEWTQALADSYWNVFQAYNLIGGVILFLVLLRLRARPVPAIADGPQLHRAYAGAG